VGWKGIGRRDNKMTIRKSRALLVFGFALIAFVFGLSFAALGQNKSPNEQRAAEELVQAANRDRAPEHLQTLRRDPALDKAAERHAIPMVASGHLSHQLPGEPNLTVRVRQAGIHASTVAENVADAPTAAEINNEWMHSPSHRANLLDPRLNAIGVAVIEQHGELYAVQDFAREVPSLTSVQQERKVASQLQSQGIKVIADRATARAYCNGSPRHVRPLPRLVMRYSTTDLTHLPPQVVEGISGGKYHRAAVGACAEADQNGFIAYQMVVLLY